MMSFADYSFDPSQLPNASDDDREPGPSNFKGIKRGSRGAPYPPPDRLYTVSDISHSL